MKKKINIALIIFLVIVYGGIAYKYLGKKSVYDQTIATSYSETEIRLPETIKDENTFLLSLSNRDPFLDKKYNSPKRSSLNSQSQKTSRTRASKKSLEIHWPSITYLGFTKSNSQTKKTAVLRIDGKLYKEREGSTINEMKILKIVDDSIYMMLHKKEKKYFYRNTQE